MNTNDMKPQLVDKWIVPGRTVDRIVVGSVSELKKKVFLAALSEISFLSHITPEFVCCDNSGNPEQPVNSGAKCAGRRLNKMKSNDTNPTDSTLYIAIENGVDTKNVPIPGRITLPENSDPKTVVDVCYVVLHLKEETFVSQSIPIDCPEKYFLEAMALDSPDFKLAEDGFEHTVGEVIHKAHPEIPANNWMADTRFSLITRDTQMFGAIRTGLIKVLIAENVAVFQDFPLPGVEFKDLSYVLGNPDLLRYLTEGMTYDMLRLGWDKKCDKLAGLDARGFIYAPLIAMEIDKGFIMIRKKGKLPGEKITLNYDTEYSNSDIEIMKETVVPGENIILVDD